MFWRYIWSKLSGVFHPRLILSICFRFLRLLLLFPLLRGHSFRYGKSMNLIHLFRQRSIYHSMPLQQSFPFKFFGYNLNCETCTASANKFHSSWGRIFVNNFKMFRWICIRSRTYPPDVSMTSWNARQKQKVKLIKTRSLLEFKNS